VVVNGISLTVTREGAKILHVTSTVKKGVFTTVASNPGNADYLPPSVDVCTDAEAAPEGARVSDGIANLPSSCENSHKA
jgi:hypothetical protein